MVWWNNILISKKGKELQHDIPKIAKFSDFSPSTFLEGIDQRTVVYREIYPKIDLLKAAIMQQVSIVNSNTYLLHQKCASVKNQIQNASKSTVDILRNIAKFCHFVISCCNSFPFLLIKILFHHTIFSFSWRTCFWE